MRQSQKDRLNNILSDIEFLLNSNINIAEKQSQIKNRVVIIKMLIDSIESEYNKKVAE